VYLIQHDQLYPLYALYVHGFWCGRNQHGSDTPHTLDLVITSEHFVSEIENVSPLGKSWSLYFKICLSTALSLADFGRNPWSSYTSRGSRNFFIRYITHDFADFPSDKFHEISTQQSWSVSRWNLMEQNFENFTIRSRFSKTYAKIAHNLFRSCNFRPS